MDDELMKAVERAKAALAVIEKTFTEMASNIAKSRDGLNAIRHELKQANKTAKKALDT